MAVMESVAVRQRGGYDFATHYDNLCALHNTCPLSAVKANLAQRVLDINADRIRTTDWLPILNTLKINKTLEFIAVRSFFQQHVDEAEERGFSVKRKIPSIRSKEISYRLCRALKDCLSINQNVMSIELQGIPLRERDVACLAKGISSSTSLKHMSVEYSVIGDDLVEILCHVVKNAMSITSLNFTGCGLSWKSAEILAEAIKHQAMLRHNEAWKDSLRYRRPDLDRMSGLRRITLNCNTLIADQGTQLLADVLKDDLWVKAVDLQKCGLTNNGAKCLLEILKYNTTLVVVDVRQNPLIDASTMKNIMDQVVINAGGQPTEYQWIKAEPLQDPNSQKQRRKKTKTIMSNFGRKMTVKVSSNGSARKRSGSDPPSATRPTAAMRPSPGIPWRAALRATRCRGYPPDQSVSLLSFCESVTDQSQLTPNRSPGRPVGDTPDDQCVTRSAGDRTRGMTEDVRVELEQLRRRAASESSARIAAEQRATQMSIENCRLRQELDELQARRSLLDDDRVLDSIEQSFQQFHSFLDLLRDAGLGKLITMAGLDSGNLPSPFAGKPVDSPAGLINGRSRHETTLQMKSFLEQSQLDESSFIADPVRPGLNGLHVSRSHLDTRSDPTLRQTGAGPDENAPSSRPSSKFDELYQKALKDTENILSAGSQFDVGSSAKAAHVPSSHSVASSGSKKSSPRSAAAASQPENDSRSEKSSLSGSRRAASHSDRSRVSGHSGVGQSQTNDGNVVRSTPDLPQDEFVPAAGNGGHSNRSVDSVRSKDSSIGRDHSGRPTATSQKSDDRSAQPRHGTDRQVDSPQAVESDISCEYVSSEGDASGNFQ